MILAALLALQAGRLPVDAGMIGAFRHGAWDCICWRDGNLSGFSQELCRAWWHRNGPVAVELERTVRALEISVSSPRCAAVDVRLTPTSTFKGRRRTALVAAAIRRIVARRARRCHSTGQTLPLSVNDIAAVLTETDGLVRLYL